MWGYFFAVFRFGKVKVWFVPAVSMTGNGLIALCGALAGALKQTADLLMLGGLAVAAAFFVLLSRKKIHVAALSLCGVCFARRGSGVRLADTESETGPLR